MKTYGNGYFAGFRMTVGKCIILDYYVAVFVNVRFWVGSSAHAVVYARSFVLEAAGSNPTLASFLFFRLFF